MDNCYAVVVRDDTDLERLTSSGRTDEHRDLGIVGLEGSPMMSKGWSMSSSVTPCLRAAGSTSTT
jgi:hypothetical protein